jgi:hypothetical protein
MQFSAGGFFEAGHRRPSDRVNCLLTYFKYTSKSIAIKGRRQDGEQSSQSSGTTRS